MSGETQRQWLARQLLDDRLSDKEAFGITAYHPSVSTEYHGGKYVGGTATIKVLIGECDQCHDVNRRLRAELSRLTADNERLREALTKAADAMDSVTVFVTSRERINRPTGEEWWEMEKSQARAALTKEPTP